MIYNQIMNKRTGLLLITFSVGCAVHNPASPVGAQRTSDQQGGNVTERPRQLVEGKVELECKTGEKVSISTGTNMGTCTITQATGNSDNATATCLDDRMDENNQVMGSASADCSQSSPCTGSSGAGKCTIE